jgi:hypothetical protein
MAETSGFGHYGGGWSPAGTQYGGGHRSSFEIMASRPTGSLAYALGLTFAGVAVAVVAVPAARFGVRGVGVVSRGAATAASGYARKITAQVVRGATKGAARVAVGAKVIRTTVSYGRRIQQAWENRPLERTTADYGGRSKRKREFYDLPY